MNYKLNEDGITLSLVSVGNCFDTEIIIPSFIEGKKVTRILKNAFLECDGITSITFGKNIKIVEDYAISYCKNLKKIVVSDSLEYFEPMYLVDCALTDLKVENDFVYIGSHSNERFILLKHTNFDSETIKLHEDIRWLSAYAFQQHKFKTILLNNGLKKIGRWCFNNSDNVVSLNIPMTVELIDEYAFYECSNLSDININSDAKLKEIGKLAFSKCVSLESISLPINLEKLGERCFQDCSGLKNVQDFGKIREIPDYCFNECISLSKIGSIEQVEIIGTRAFFNCKSLKSINIKDNICKIGGQAFSNSGLEGEIELTVNEIELGEGVFSSCENISKVIVKIGTLIGGEWMFAYCDNIELITIDLDEIPNYMFHDCGEVLSLSISDKTSKIGAGAFSGNKLKTIKFPSALKYIGYQAFSNNLFEEVIIPNGVEYLGAECFSSCGYLKWAVIPKSVIVAEKHIFKGAGYWYVNIDFQIYCEHVSRPEGFEGYFSHNGMNYYNVIWGNNWSFSSDGKPYRK